MTQTSNTKLAIPLWLVWLAAVGSVLAFLGSYGILDNNEGLYAEIPREMLAGHDWRLWVIPHLNGLPYMEKPPLLYWLTACSFSLFGIHEWSARMVPALSSLACVAMLLQFGKAIGKEQVGRLAGLMFVSGVGVAQMSRTLMFDMLLTVCLTGALMAAHLYSVERKPAMLRLAYAALALALMAKGVAALLLFGMVMSLFLLPALFKDGFFATCRAWLQPGALLIFFVIAAPWHIAASMVEPIFPWFYFINEHVLRFLGKREPHDYYSGPLWYYLPRMLIYLFPWSFLLLGLLQRRLDADTNETRKLSRFLLLAWILPLLFFSVSSAKANYYLVVVMPFAAFQLALALERREFLSARWRLAPGLLLAFLTGVGAAYLVLRGARMAAEPLILGMPPVQFATGALAGLCVLSLCVALVAWKWSRVGVASYVAVSAWCIASLLLAINAIEPTVSTRPLAQFLQAELPGRPVYLYRNFEELSSLPYYLGTPLHIIDSRSNDLFWGNKLQVNDLLIDDAQFGNTIATQQVAVVVMEKQLKDFRASSWFITFKGQKQVGNNTVFYN